MIEPTTPEMWWSALASGLILGLALGLYLGARLESARWRKERREEEASYRGSRRAVDEAMGQQQPETVPHIGGLSGDPTKLPPTRLVPRDHPAAAMENPLRAPVVVEAGDIVYDDAGQPAYRVRRTIYESEGCLRAKAFEAVGNYPEPVVGTYMPKWLSRRFYQRKPGERLDLGRPGK